MIDPGKLVLAAEDHLGDAWEIGYNASLGGVLTFKRPIVAHCLEAGRPAEEHGCPRGRRHEVIRAVLTAAMWSEETVFFMWLATLAAREGQAIMRAVLTAQTLLGAAISAISTPELNVAAWEELAECGFVSLEEYVPGYATVVVTNPTLIVDRSVSVSVEASPELVDILKRGGVQCQTLTA